MTEKPESPGDLVEGKVPVVVSARQVDRRDSGQVLTLDGAVRSAPKKHSSFAVTPGKLKEALVYRWRSALAVGLILACVGAGLAWVTYKPKYTAVTAMRIAFSKQSILPGAPAENERSIEKRQKNEAQIIKSRDLLRAVLKTGDIRSLETIRNEEDPVEWLEKELQASFVKDTDFFRIALSGENPEDVTKIVNAVRKVYIEKYKYATNSQQAQQLQNIAQIVVNSQEKIKKERDFLKGLATSFDTGELQVLTLKQKMAVEEFGDRRRELSKLEAEMRANEALLVVQEFELKATETPGTEKLTVGLVEEWLEKDPRVQQANIDIRQSEAQIKKYKLKVTGTNPRLTEMEASLTKARGDLENVKIEIMPEVTKRIQNLRRVQRALSLQSTHEKLAVAKAQRTEVAKIVEKLAEDAKKIGIGSIEIENRRHSIETQEELLRTLRATKERLEIEISNERDLVFNEMAAEVPTVNQASLLKSGSLFSLGGLLIGLLGVSYFEARLHRVHRSAQVDQELGIQILGVLPILAQKNSQPYGEVKVANETIPDIMFTDAVNNLCARVLCDDRLTKNSIVMVTSAAENEGKTMLATQLAAGLARLGRRTLLLDCDFRNSRCHDQVGLPAGPGLGEVLCDEAELAKVIQTVPDSDARILMAGKSNSQVAKALNNGKFAALLALFRNEYDYVIVDSAPTPVVSDGLLIGKLSDGVILVVRPKVSKAAEVVAAFDQLAALKIPILGSVVNANLAWVSGKYYK
jgi:polysaccharide biosynthesis transport protein